MLRAILQLTKGLIRDPKTRRTVMFYLMVTALVILFIGVAFIPDGWAREHVWLYIGYWLLCAWVTLSAMLLAIFDILLIRAANRIQRRKTEADLLRATKENRDET